MISASRIHRYNRCNVGHESFQLGPVRHQVAGKIESSAQIMRLGYPGLQVLLQKIVVAHAQTVARQSGIDGVGYS